jgi:hypothetical protein
VTGAIENVEIPFFLHRVRLGRELELPIDAMLKAAQTTPEARSGDEDSDDEHR